MILTILPILFSVTTASSPGGNQGLNIDSVGYGYGGNGTYHVSVFLYNSQFGTPVQKTNVTILAGNSTFSGLTGSSGYFNKTLNDIDKSEAGNLTYNYQVLLYGSVTNFTRSINIGKGTENPYFTYTHFEYIENKSIVNQSIYYPRVSIFPLSVQNHPNINTFGVQYNLAGLSSGPNLYIYYKLLSTANTSSRNGGSVTTFSSQELTYSNITTGNLSLLSRPSNSIFTSAESQLHFLEEVKATPVSSVNVLNLTSNGSSRQYLFEVFSQNGTELAYAQVLLTNTYTTAQVSSIFYSGELPLLGIFVPLMAVLSGYTTFGKDKLEGSLNYVLVRPLSRRALISSRFLSNNIAILIPTIVSLGISSAVFHYYLGTYIPEDTLMLSIWVIIVMSAGFTGMVYLASTLTKSAGKLIGFSIGLFMILDIFWSLPVLRIIPALATSFMPVGTYGFAFWNVVLDFVTPSGFVNIVSYIGYGTTSMPVYLGNFHLSQLGISSVSLLIFGILWILVPYMASVLRFSRAD